MVSASAADDIFLNAYESTEVSCGEHWTTAVGRGECVSETTEGFYLLDSASSDATTLGTDGHEMRWCTKVSVAGN